MSAEIVFRRLEHEPVNASLDYLRGPGTRQLIIDATGKIPRWSRAGRAWCLQPSTAADVLAYAEANNVFVVSTVRPTTTTVEVHHEPVPDDRQERDDDGLLW